MPEWLNNAIFYEIYPQSFFDSNADGVGDLEGIIRKLDYIKELGCNAIWLNPCFDSPFYDAGYDVRDYMKIAPRYGTNEDMRRLFREAHARSMHVILDLVPGHTSIDHEWFKKSMQRDKEYANRYIWTETPWEKFDNIKGITGSITGFCNRGSCAVNYYSTQPALNYGFADPDPEKPWQIPYDSSDALATRNAMLEVMQFWFDMGCDGFRVDLAFTLVKDDNDYRVTMQLWQEIRAILDTKYPEAVILSEWGDPKRSLAAGFHMDFLLHFSPTGTAVYNTLFREDPYFSSKGRDDLSEFVTAYNEMLQSAGSDGFICLPSSNHDMSRIAHLLSVDELRLAFAFLLSMPGVPFIYYGDEIGMRYLEGTPSVEGGYERTGSRSPMQWDSTLNAGFSSCKPGELYIPLDPASDRPDVKKQMAENDSVWCEVQKLISFRQTHDTLQNRSPIEFISYGGKLSPLAYRRGNGDDSMIIALNPSSEEATITIENMGDMGVAYSIGKPSRIEGNVVSVPPGSCAFLKHR